MPPLAPLQPAAPARRPVIHTDIPARLDRLPWTRFHWLLVIALGVTWVLDGLEGTIVGAITPVLEHTSLHLTAGQMGAAATLYIVVRPRAADARDPDAAVGSRLLLRLGGGQRRLPDGE